MLGVRDRASLAQGVQSALRSLQLGSNIPQLRHGHTRLLIWGPSAPLHIMCLLFSLSTPFCAGLHFGLAHWMLLLDAYKACTASHIKHICVTSLWDLGPEHLTCKARLTYCPVQDPTQD